MERVSFGVGVGIGIGVEKKIIGIDTDPDTDTDPERKEREGQPPAMGRRTLKTEPSPGLLFTVTAPLWSLTIPCTTARPMPDPSPFALVV